MGVKFSNNGHSTLAASISSSDTSLTVASGHGARFPSLGAGDYFYATLIDASNNLEIVKCTARSSDVLTIARGQESTTARAYAIGDRIELRVTAQGIADATTVNLDGDKGDITVSSSGATWSIDNNVVGADELNVSGDGTSGQVLTSDADGSFSWADASSGSIVQTKFSSESGAGGSFSGIISPTEYNSSIRVTITPTSSSNKIIAFASLGFAVAGGSRIGFMLYKSTDGGSSFSRCNNIGESAAEMYRNLNSSQQWFHEMILFRDDSPSTTSTIYTVYYEVNTATGGSFGDNTGNQGLVIQEVEPS